MNLLENLQKKPLKIRKKIMWISVSSLTLIIFLFWLFLAPHGSNSEETSSLDLSKLKEGVKERVNESGITNLSGEIKEATKELSESDKKEEELKINKDPRLPLEIGDLENIEDNKAN